MTRPLILASASPRRAELLSQIGIPFTVLASHIEEPPPLPGEDVLIWAMKAAADKARATATLCDPSTPAIIVSADTAVLLPLTDHHAAPLLHGQPVEVMGKPQSPMQAQVMLQRLSGRMHVVISAFALYAHPEGEVVTRVEETSVTFRQLSSEEIVDYVATGEPLDKAGAYGIQGRGAVLIDRIKGDYYTVVGLPLASLWHELARWT